MECVEKRDEGSALQNTGKILSVLFESLESEQFSLDCAVSIAESPFSLKRA